jgi:hypothetical protein
MAASKSGDVSIIARAVLLAHRVGLHMTCRNSRREALPVALIVVGSEILVRVRLEVGRDLVKERFRAFSIIPLCV